MNYVCVIFYNNITIRLLYQLKSQIKSNKRQKIKIDKLPAIKRRKIGMFDFNDILPVCLPFYKLNAPNLKTPVRNKQFRSNN